MENGIYYYDGSLYSGHSEAEDNGALYLVYNNTDAKTPLASIILMLRFGKSYAKVTGNRDIYYVVVCDGIILEGDTLLNSTNIG